MVFCEEYTIVILNQLNINKIKSTKKILENITKKQKEKRTMQGKTIAIYSIS
jgi:hypothetical protein